MIDLSTGTALCLDAFNSAPADEARQALAACCASRRWLAELVAARPYADLGALLEASEHAVAALDWPDLLEALSAHPRIGDRAAGPGREATWSRGEQSAAATTDERLRAELVAGNLDYERRFGHVFLICASGLSTESVLNALRDRLRNDEAAEHEQVRVELGRIVALRLAKLVSA